MEVAEVRFEFILRVAVVDIGERLVGWLLFGMGRDKDAIGEMRVRKGRREEVSVLSLLIRLPILCGRACLQVDM